jgi:hypothetical protein
MYFIGQFKTICLEEKVTISESLMKFRGHFAHVQFLSEYIIM